MPVDVLEQMRNGKKNKKKKNRMYVGVKIDVRERKNYLCGLWWR
jgi:hypothetical protein